MKYKDEYKVEFRTESYDYGGKKERYVYYRIVPSELPLLRRWFSNPWMSMYRPYKWVADFDYRYEVKEYMDEILPLKTYGDVRRYLEAAKSTVRKRKLEQVANGEIWPDEVD